MSARNWLRSLRNAALEKTPVRTLPANPETISTVASLEMMHSAPGTAIESLDLGRSGLSVIALDHGAGVEEIAWHQKRSARSSSIMTRAIESLIVDVA